MGENNDSVTEVTTQSWGSKLKSSIGSMLFGIVLFIGAFPLLWWNEGRAVGTLRSLQEMQKVVVSVEDAKALPANEGKLIHIVGSAKTADVLRDDEFGVSANAIALTRSVSMYQWIEQSQSDSKKKVGGSTETTTTYTYSKGWSDTLHNSSKFKKQEGHQNPGEMRYRGDNFQAENVAVGDFKLSQSLISRIGGSESFSISKAALAGIPKAKVTGSIIYIGADPDNPAVGDYKVSYSVKSPGKDVSIIAKQMGKSLTQYMSKRGKQMELLSMGTLSADDMITKSKQQNTLITWLIRVGGLVLMGLGFSMIFSPLVALAEVLPFLSSLLGAGIGLVSFLVALALSFVTIAIAWIFYRPVLGILLLVAAAGAIVLVFVLGKNKKKAPAAAA
ncbi:MAG: TMEM43 family protein [Spirochaetes bacterium]|nr:TMEM43 family protein [Spirochaetota bacterium]